MNTAIVIQAGGTGTRLWPLSRNTNPKQFVSIFNERSLIQNTYDRLIQKYENKDIFISTNIAFTKFIEDQLPSIPRENYILEPKKMDKTAAFGLINLHLIDKGYDNIVLIACDDYIGNVPGFLNVLGAAEEACNQNPDKILLIGINPNHPATGYGYIEMGEPVGRYNGEIAFKVESFKEKPDFKTAEKYVADWKYLWNAGWFIFNAKFMDSVYKQHLSDTYQHLQNCYKLDPYSPEFLAEFAQCKEASFDVEIVEKMKDVIVLPANIGWSDVGSWKLVKDILTDQEDDANVFKGNVYDQDTHGTMVYSNDQTKPIAVIGLKNIVIVDTGDTLLVSSIDKAQEVKKIVEKLPKEYI